MSSGRTAFVTQVKAQLFREYVRAVGDFDLLQEFATLSTVADDPIVELPDDFLKILTVRLGLIVLNPQNDESTAQARAAEDSAGAAIASPRRYRFMPPDRIFVTPTPTETSADAGELFYVQRPATWTLDADTPSALPEEFHDYLAEGTIFRMAMNQEEFSTHSASAASAMGMMRSQIQLAMNLRQGKGSSRVIRKVYG